MKIICVVLKELEKIDEAEEFIDRVEKERAEDYDDIIETQMYLTRMKQKVNCGDYDTPQEVCLSHPQNHALLLYRFVIIMYLI
jgi:hypothetical protein